MHVSLKILTFYAFIFCAGNFREDLVLLKNLPFSEMRGIFRGGVKSRQHRARATPTNFSKIREAKSEFTVVFSYPTHLDKVLLKQ
jgi:hypothetical protein